jgi:hypothetical protein
MSDLEELNNSMYIFISGLLDLVLRGCSEFGSLDMNLLLRIYSYVVNAQLVGRLF